MNILLARAWFFCFLVLPSLADAALALDSRGRTTLVLSALAVALAAGRVRNLRMRGGAVILLLLVLTWGLLALGMSPTEKDLPAFIGTAIGLVIAFTLAYLLSDSYTTISQDTIRKLAFALFIDATVIGFVSLGFFKLGIEVVELRYFPFSEPAHFARLYGPVALTALYLSGKVLRRLGILGLMMLFALAFPSLSILVYAAWGALIYVLTGGRKDAVNLLRAAGVCVVAAAVYLSLNAEDVEYFADRVTISNESTNFTTLVFLQGIEAARTSLTITDGIGLGLHQLGMEPANEVTDHIEWLGLQSGLYGFELNRRDGGFIAAKLVAELGIPGMLLVLAIFFLQVRALLTFVRQRHRHDKIKENIARIVLISFSVEFFLRGAGYFSLPLIAAAAAILWLSSAKQLHEVPTRGALRPSQGRTS